MALFCLFPLRSSPKTGQSVISNAYFEVLRKLVRVPYQMPKVYHLLLTLLNPNKPRGLTFDKLVTTVKKEVL